MDADGQGRRPGRGDLCRRPSIVSDPLPAGANYAAPSAGNFIGISNSDRIDCAILGGTLTCTGWGAQAQVYRQRRVVVADLVRTEPASTLSSN